jgi:nucleoside-diphosphate-sugar epimerase
VVGVDCFTDYYARPLKEANLIQLRDHPRFHLVEADLGTADLAPLLDDVEVVFHQAAQAGVRASWGTSFADYTHNNVLATQRLLEAVKDRPLRKFVYASSSSVYGDTRDLPMRETSLPRPYSPYGVTKLAAEHLCELYRRNFGVPTISLRYFTVYGPRQRPDMGFHRFIRFALSGQPIPVYGDGEQTRDFTFISDAVEANLLALREGVIGVFNIGGGSRVTVNQVLQMLQEIMGVRLQIEHQERQHGDVRHTWADTSAAREALGFVPEVALREGLTAQVEWQSRMMKG